MLESALTPELVKAVLAPQLTLSEARKSRRRFVNSHWYWLRRN